MSDVRVSSIPVSGGKQILRICIEARERLNALRHETTAVIGDAVRRGDRDGDVVLIWLEGAGERSFCVGGDVRFISREYLRGDRERALSFFTTEYRTDYAIHMARTPVLGFAHGIVMGGGIGMLAGCRHKVLTLGAMLAMPEVSIGFFPDVGATWFLNRMPRGCGRLLGLAGFRMDAADACFVGLGDRVVREEDREAIFESLRSLGWSGNPERDGKAVDAVLARFSLPPEAGFLAKNPEYLERFALASDPEAFGEAVKMAGRREPSLAEAAKIFSDASPFSIHLTWKQLEKGRHLSLKQAFCLELVLVARSLEQKDFHEGVRALLVDKDKRPRWQNADPGTVDSELIRRCFTPPWPQSVAHPLEDLPDPALAAGWS